MKTTPKPGSPADTPAVKPAGAAATEAIAKPARKPARKPTKSKAARAEKLVAEARPVPAAAVEMPAPVKPAPRRPRVTQAKAEAAVPTVTAAVPPPKPARRKAGTKLAGEPVPPPAPTPGPAVPAAKPKRVRRAVAATPAKRKPTAVGRRQGLPNPASDVIVPPAAVAPKTKPVPVSQRSLLLELLRAAPEPKLPPIPPILLEGDPPVAPVVRLPAVQPATQPTPAAPVPRPEPVPVLASVAVAKPAAVPRAGALFPSGGSLWLTVRDPFCVCAHWDFAAAALSAYAAEHRGGSWRLRVWTDGLGGRLANDQPLPTETAHHFVPVLWPGVSYHAEVGFRQADGAWLGLAVSRPATTPPDGASAEDTVTFATLAAEPVTPETLRSTPPDAPAVVVHPASRAALLSLPDLTKAAQLTALVRRELHRTAPGNSGEVTELVGEHVVLPGGAQLGPTAGGRELPVLALPALPSSESAPPPAPAVPRGFWFKVNAEVILHGSTERDARVTIGGHPVKLREDGSFSFRFTLPDGEFELPVVAVSAAGDNRRAAQVTFSRATVLRGEVGAQPQDAALLPPTSAAIG